IWAGGVIGASMVLAATVLVPRLGAGALFCLIVLGQVLGAMALDHFGVLGAQRPVDMARVAGALLVVVGAALVVRPWQACTGPPACPTACCMRWRALMRGRRAPTTTSATSATACAITRRLPKARAGSSPGKCAWPCSTTT